MHRDYHDLQELQEKPEPLSALRWLPYFSVGLGIGLAVALIVLLRTYFIPQPILQYIAAEPDCPPPTQTTAEAAAGTAVNEDTKFEFYTVLPQMEVRVDPWDLEEAVAGGRSLPSGAYYLQSGSYRKMADAERLRTQLYNIGVETHIQKVDLGTNGVWHRVRAGPYNSAEKLNRARSLLTRNGVRFILLRDAAETSPHE